MLECNALQWRLLGRGGSSDGECRLNLSPGWPSHLGGGGEKPKLLFLGATAYILNWAPCFMRSVLAWGSSVMRIEEGGGEATDHILMLLTRLTAPIN